VSDDRGESTDAIISSGPRSALCEPMLCDLDPVKEET